MIIFLIIVSTLRFETAKLGIVDIQLITSSNSQKYLLAFY